MAGLELSKVQSARSNAELIHDAKVVEDAITTMAEKINVHLADKYPLILCVMIGGIIPAGMLLPKLSFALQMDYIHATRYRGKTAGGTLHWSRRPEKSLAGKTILIIDDILDHGTTITQIIEYCRQNRANEIYTAVLVEKELPGNEKRPRADFCELTVPNRYVFGYGMDYHEYHRNCNGIYALREP